jgi:TetR/AcrR family transcriptional repressor of nem operon
VSLVGQAAICCDLAERRVGKTAAAKRKKAIVTFASMLGALVIARAVNDPKVSEEILETVSASVAGSA